MNIRLGNNIKNIIGFLLSAVILYFIIVRLVKYWNDLSSSLSNANWALISAGVIYILIGEMLIVLMWREFMKELYNKKLSFFQSFILVFLPNAARYIPGKIWFVFGITYFAKRWGIDAVSALVVSLISQIMVLLTAVVVGVIYIGFSGVYKFSYWSIIFLILIVALLLRPAILHSIFEFVLKIFKRTREIDIKQLPQISLKVLLKTLVLGILLWIFIGIGVTISGMGLIKGIKWDDIFVITGTFSISYFIGYASIITPAGLGVREGMFILLLPDYLSETQKLVFSVSSRIWMTIAEILIFVVGGILLKLKIKEYEKYDKSSSHSDGISSQR